MKKTLMLLLSLALAAFATAPTALAGDVTGRFDRGTAYEEPAAHAPAAVSRMYARSVPRAAANASVELPAAGGSGMIVWTIPVRTNQAGKAVGTRLRTPSGAILKQNDRGSLERGLRRFAIDASEAADLGLGLPAGAHDVVHVMDTAAASYHLDVEMPDDVAGVTVVAAEPESRLTLSTWAAPLSRQPGEPVTLHAELRDGDAPIAGATVTARLAAPNGRAFDAVTLTDRGDGVYTATLADLPARTPGAWQVRFEAEGATPEGTRFARTGSGELVAERGAARFGAIRSEVVGDVLRVTADVDVAIAGTYRFDVIVADGGQAVAWGEGVRKLSPGATKLEMDLPVSEAEGAVVDVRLLGLDEMGVAARAVRRQ